MGRKPKNMKLRKHVYIFTEGCTEFNYFEMLNKKYNLTTSIKIELTAVGKSGKKLLEYAEGKLSKLNKEARAMFDSAYIIFDKDELDYMEVENVISLARKKNINIGFSNECFEAWLASHFEKPNVSFTKKNLYKKMEQYLDCKQYSKKHKDNKELLTYHCKDRVSIAMENCKTFGMFNQTEIKTFPYTNIGQVVKTIYKQEIY